jgi:solute carrier family 25 phosphate transporter 23/24/25/41
MATSSQQGSPAKELSERTLLLWRIGAGASAGALTKTCVAPLERVKILFQLQGMSNQPKKYVTIPQALREVSRTEGVIGLWRGNGANVVRVVPVYGLKFGTNDYFKELVAPGVRRPTTSQLMLVSCDLPRSCGSFSHAGCLHSERCGSSS